MNGVEAAASLFGSEEPASDPFATLGAGPAAQSSAHDLFNEDGASGASDFLNASQDPFTSGNNAEQDTSQYYTQPESTANYFTASNYTDSGASGTNQQGWYDQQGHWQSYEQPEQRAGRGTIATPASYIPEQQQYTTAGSTYEPYTPATNNDAPPVNAAPQTQSPYNAYTVPQPTSNYLPSQPRATTTSTYSQYTYTPSAPQAPASQYTPSYSGASQTPYGGVQAEQVAPPRTSSSAVVPPPVPAPATTITRPKISNAYDPPFPTTTKANRRGARTTSGQPSYGHGANVYETMSPPVGGYTPSSQTSPYVSHTPPPPQAAPPQRLPPPPPAQAQVPSQSLPPPPTRGTAPPVQPSNNQGGGYGVPSESGPIKDYAAGATSYGNGIPEGFSLESPSQDAGPWTSQLSGPESAPSTVGHSGAPADSHASGQYEDPEASSPDPPAEPKPDYDSYAVPSQSGDERFRPPPASPPAPALGSPLSLASSIRASTPNQHSLPPSPILKGQQGHSGPFVDSVTSSARRTASPQSFMEPSRERTPDSDAHTASRDTARTADVRSSQQALNSQLRSSSPALSFVNGVRSPPVAGATNPYVPKSVVGGVEGASVPANLPNGHSSAPPDPYAPKLHMNGYRGERTTSPSSFTAPSAAGPPQTAKTYPATNPYAPQRGDLRNRSMSNSSMLSSTSTGPEDPYAPSQRARRIPSEADYGNYSSRYNYANGQEASHPSTLHPEYAVQELPMKSFQTPYAPSPSLLGANDPLGRTSARVPVISFGFGGKLVTCFHGADQLSTGFDVALSSRNSTGVHIRVLNSLIPQSALDTSTASFPGPLHGDPGSPTTSLVRTGVTSQTKTKKAKVTKYLSERTDELALGLRYITPDSIESCRAEGKLVLVKLLQLMVEHDGRLTGTPQLDIAVRTALVPRLEGTFGVNNGFAAVADTQGAAPTSTYSALPGSSNDSQGTTISVTTLRSSALDKIQDFLLRGERRQAYHYALDEKLWAHAMVIASSIDKEAWKEVVGEFLRTELGDAQSGDRPSTQPNGRESLRTAYSLFSGQGAASVHELVPQNLLTRVNGRLQPQLPPHLTPRTPNFAAMPVPTANLPLEILSKWAETAAMMLSSSMSQETSSALTALGDYLAANQLFEAAHVCYLLAPQTSPLGGICHPSARIIVVGSRNPQTWPGFAKDQDPLIFSEIVEFALSLATPSKGQDAFSGIAHLQAYRFIRATALAEIGDIQQANRYCDAITATINRNSPYSTPALLDQLKGLSDRIGGVTQVDKSFWTGAKLSKPSLDTIGGWLEGRFTKLVTGEADMEKSPEEMTSKPDDRGFSGPFAHYSEISSTTPSARSSPQPTVVNLNVLPPARSGSAMATTSSYAHPQIDRASSAMDYVRRKPSPGPRVVSANAATTSFANVPSFGQALESHHYSPNDDLVTPRPSLTGEESQSAAQEATWWGGTAYAEDTASRTPTASTFLRVDETTVQASTSSDGFISLMDTAAYSVGPASPAKNMSQLSPGPGEEDEEDLGFGNSSSRRERREKSSDSSEQNSTSSPEPAKPAAPPEPENKPAPAAGGWFSRWWKKSDASPGPIKASLGEESSFYYDPDLKRWVNKKAGGVEVAKAATPPPPPSRAQTASPGMTGPRPPGVSDPKPPPGRSASAIDLSTSPPSRTTMRVRSNLVPTPDSAPSTPTGTRLAPPGPPPGRPKSQASKRNVRSRYVDVFQQESGA
ncbi:putative involved in the initiation of assembly of the COPII coat required for the formation of transport vesicles from the endoplasmic reticulum (ER) and the selection of cargo molecules [Lyophyllum shimeji]|uniref:Protein transport protein sec16 n=1 Tax=Lyophyllum shimeji TaxID=47721 RepID=A0A9P3PGD4_LYOSH|nr:putative involved in the initiation of assembly of the COPII coat required for the formation of transport vesicles from the endoplasmic reticulum (ER) and the selection of cargo molecules [Lyophyllum shimeji]